MEERVTTMLREIHLADPSTQIFLLILLVGLTALLAALYRRYTRPTAKAFDEALKRRSQSVEEEIIQLREEARLAKASGDDIGAMEKVLRIDYLKREWELDEYAG